MSQATGKILSPGEPNYEWVMKDSDRWRACAECGKSGRELQPVYWRSSDASWAALAGRAGFEIQCPDHPLERNGLSIRGRLGFVLTSMN